MPLYCLLTALSCSFQFSLLLSESRYIQIPFPHPNFIAATSPAPHPRLHQKAELDGHNLHRLPMTVLVETDRTHGDQTTMVMELVVVDGEEGGAAGTTAIVGGVGDAMVDGAVVLAADIEAREVQGTRGVRMHVQLFGHFPSLFPFCYAAKPVIASI